MRRTAILGLCAALAACQEYHFNPVGRCTIQPGQKRVQLEAFSTADILFVVDDSGSMEPVQDNLATNFSAFIQQLATTQQDRASRGLEPLDFHIAVTTSSIFEDRATGTACGGTPLTCNVPTPRYPTDPNNYACPTAGDLCGDLVDRYYGIGTAQCTQGVAPGNDQPYPAGSFVAAGSNPKVLHFVKTLDWANWSTDAAIGTLMTQFGQNIRVGSCGSGQEQHLEAGKLALEKAIAGAQTAPAAEWPHAGAKLLAVWVGNEDDCSNPKDPARAVVMQTFNLGADSCNGDQQRPAAQQRLFPVDRYGSFFGSLGRPFAAAFIRPGDPGCDCVGGSCGGYSPANRFKATANAFRALGAQVVEGSVCSASFSTTLQQIADLVKPLETLQLPSQPAAGVVTRLRIVDAANKTVRLCDGPDTTREWWFVAPGAGGACTNTSTPTAPSGTTPSTCVAIRKGGGCEASPGQAYVAEYLGRVPAGGCTVGASGASQCATALGGSAADWTCDGVAGQQGTCLCAP